MDEIKLFDSHAHLDMSDEKGGEGGAAAQIQRAWEAGLVGIVTIAGATGAGEYSESFTLAEREERIWVATGIHPHIGSEATLKSLDTLRRALDHEKNVALGEIGLDYHYNRSTPAQQREAFVKQLRMAHQVEKPAIIHTREADDDILQILADEGASELGGVIHCFSGGERLAEGALDMGFHISFSGIVTFPKAEEVQAVARMIPQDRIMAETDSPFLSPIPFRGRPNEPARVEHVVRKLAEIRGVSPADMGDITVSNTRRCFKIT